jgi:hypothetical protein
VKSVKKRKLYAAPAQDLFPSRDAGTTGASSPPHHLPQKSNEPFAQPHDSKCECHLATSPR